MKFSRSSVTAPALVLAAFAALAAPVFSPAHAVVEDWQLDPYHSQAIVLVDHYGLARLGGIFGQLTGTVKVDASDWSGWEIDVKIPVFEFLSTHQPRTDAVKGPQLLDAANYPMIEFKSTKVEKSGETWVATGSLTVRGVTKEVSVPFKVRGPRSDPFGATRIGIEGEVTVRRSEFGLPFDRKLPDGSPALGDDVTIMLQFESAKPGGKVKKPE